MARNSTIRRALAAVADEGLKAAYDAALDVLRNPAAPPTSRASASSTMIKIVEMIQKDDIGDEDLAEMTLEELDRKRRVLERELEYAAAIDEEMVSPPDEAADAGVFD